MKTWPWIICAAVWLVLVIAGAAGMTYYSSRPGDDEKAPGRWPAASGLERSKERPTLVMFAHPKCPCTRASIGELNTLMTQAQGKLKAEVVFFRPAGEAKDWAQTDLWRSAAAIPGVTVRMDEDGHAARDFRATTSGHVVLYGADGRLMFSGGITEARGHAGDNDGRSSIVEMVKGVKDGQVVQATPTYGCSLEELEAPKMAAQPR